MNDNNWFTCDIDSTDDTNNNAILNFTTSTTDSTWLPYYDDSTWLPYEIVLYEPKWHIKLGYKYQMKHMWDQ